ncbi:terminase [Micromonospora sp. CB01531]|uniref:terminase n=1 Tax=Micromonospora sp. CB01531 TaxID=1718947 RepID=UPI00093DB5D7|nr:terminase [Micromonospora sp. CB01531]OKI45104.1 terminase [Micromonospora sp. CB01531]
MSVAVAPPPMTEEEIRLLHPTYLGPTWMTREDGSWHLPERTIGWQIAGWCAEYLLAEDGGPWRFTPEQLRFILWWYAVDEDGRFIHRTGVLQRMKGWGKDPLLAVMCLVELVGPSRFDRWATADDVKKGRAAKAGDPVGKAHPQAWVQVTAVNQSQTTNTMALIPSLMSDHFKHTYKIKEGAILIRANGGRQRLEAVTSSYRALEGKRTTFTLLNETHHWVSGNNGHKMYETIDGNATKKDSRYLAITNAYLPGEDSVAERMRLAYEKIVEGKAADVGFMYDSLEAHPKTPLTAEALRIVLPLIRGDAVWLNVETIIKSIHNTTLSVARSRRMWLNQVVADEDALYGPEQWKPLEVEGALLKPGDEIAIGFDGGKTDDATALVAIRVTDMVAFNLGVWEKPDGPQGDDWQVPRHAVDSAVHDTFRVFNVRGFYADVALWESYITEWEEAYGEGLGVKAGEKSVIAWDMRGSQQRSTRAHERLMASIFDGKLHHDGDITLRRHVLNAHRRVNNYGVSFGKASEERKIDAYAALMLAHEALHDLRTRGRKVKPKTKRGYFL